MPSKRTTEQRRKRASKKAATKFGMGVPGGASAYALKKQGIYPANSPRPWGA